MMIVLHAACLVSRHVHAAAQGTLPAVWGNGTQFPALRLLSLTKNWRIVGTLPAEWSTTSSSMQKLQARAPLDVPPCVNDAVRAPDK